MPEKMGTIAALLAAILPGSLGIWARQTFVRRKDIFHLSGDHAGKPVFAYSSDCSKMHDDNLKHTCRKIDELKTGQEEMKKELKESSNTIIRIEEWIKNHAITRDRR